MRYLITSCISLLLLWVTLSGCTTQNLLADAGDRKANTPAALDSVFRYNPDYQYTIRKDDKISISIWGQDELSVGSLYGIYNSNEVYGKWLMVDANGNIEIPKIGTYAVVGKTVIQLKHELKAKFAAWLNNPIIDVKVLNKEITVLGEVRDPQVIPVDKDHNPLLELVARCKGFEFYADLRYVKVLRQVGPDVHIANLNLSKGGAYEYRNIQLQPGDVVIVPSRKSKVFDKRVATIIPFTTTVTAAGILMGLF